MRTDFLRYQGSWADVKIGDCSLSNRYDIISLSSKNRTRAIVNEPQKCQADFKAYTFLCMLIAYEEYIVRNKVGDV